MVCDRYHDRSVSDRLCPAVAGDASATKTSSDVADQCRMDDQSSTGTDALIKAAVKTGLSLVFGLLHQNLSLERQLGHQSSGGSICNNVMQTALDIVLTFEPLSLADKCRLSPLAVGSLADVTSFLRSVVCPQSSADTEARRLAAELMLVIATQRGCLRYVLEWIEMSLCATVRLDANRAVSSAGSEQEQQPHMITHATFVSVLSQMNKAMVRRITSLFLLCTSSTAVECLCCC